MIEKTCGSPPLVANSEVIQPDRTTNETIQYICEDGYQLRGSPILTCISTEWQPTPPICDRSSSFISREFPSNNFSLFSAITCDNPQDAFNGFVKSSSTNDTSKYPIDSIVHFSCATNMTLRGSRLSKCQWNGTWSPKIPRCDSQFDPSLFCIHIE